MYYNNSVPYYGENMYRQSSFRQPPRRPGGPGRPNNTGNFLLPFALGFATSPLLFGYNRPRPYYYGPYPYYPYYPYY